MKTWGAAFNSYLILLLVLCPLGCQSTRDKNPKKETTLLRLYLETYQEGNRTMPVKVPRENPATIVVDQTEFAIEGNVARAEVVEEMDGFFIRLHFDRRGAWLLENVTASNLGRHLVVFSEFGKTPSEKRWLAAPVINRRISDGILVFTPDASREEAERIVRGLNNVAAKIRKMDKF